MTPQASAPASTRTLQSIRAAMRDYRHVERLRYADEGLVERVTNRLSGEVGALEDLT